MKSSIAPLLFCFFISLLTLVVLLSKTKPYSLSLSSSSHTNPSTQIHPPLKIYVADLPRSFNYGLLDQYWSLSAPDSRINADPDAELRLSITASRRRRGPLPYPENPLIKQYGAEYWLLGDLETPARSRAVSSVIERVYDWRNADVVFVPFFATLSAEMELGWGRKGGFLKKEGNGDYRRQRDVVDRIRSSDAWKSSGGRDHVFVLTDPVAMWHVRAEIAPAVLLVVDFGGWYKLDAKVSQDNTPNTSHMIQHTQVSLIKDVIVPYTHLLPRLHLLEDKPRTILLYFKGAKHRHRGGLIRQKLWDVLLHEHDVVMEEGFPNATGREQSIKGMRSSEFCLHPAGDTPTSCRLFDAVLSLCIPVIVSDDIELPFEGMLDYSAFAVSVSVSSALQPGWLVGYLRGFSKDRRDDFRRNMAKVQHMFEYDNGSPGGIGPVSSDGAVSNIWRKVHLKLPMIREAIMREKRKPEVFVNGLVCKNPNLVNENDFFFTGLNKPGNTANQLGSKVTPVSVTQLPGLNTLGISLARVDFAPYGLNPPHTHPRASEILVVLQGTLSVGFVTSNNPDNKLFTKVLNVGDVFVFPQGLIHFQLNTGNTNAVAIAALSSQNPGVITIANAVFGSKPPISPYVLEKAFQLDQKTVQILQAKFWMNNN